MKTITTMLLFMFTLSIAQAQEEKILKKSELVRRSLERLFPHDLSQPAQVDMSDIVLEWNKVFDEQNLRKDRNKQRYDWKRLFPIKRQRALLVSGKRVFYGLFPKKYRYQVELDPDYNRIQVELKIHFYPSKTLLRKTERLHAENHPDKKYYPQAKERDYQVLVNLKQAESIWNSQAPQGVTFKFTKVNDPEEAHYSMKLTNMFGALYDKFIVSPAPSDILAHEIGHMMGLDDEYSPITSNVIPVHTLLDAVKARKTEIHFEHAAYKDMRCNLDSLMCLRETLYPYHFDHILGRIAPN